MRTTRIGQDGPESSALGLGCPALPARPGPDTDETAIATLLEAVDAGVTLLETGDFHALGGHHEMLVREALWNVPRERVLLSVSFGLQRAPDGTLLGVDARPASVKNFLTYSLRRLGTDYVDLYSPAAVDPGVPIEDTIGAIADLVQAGYVRHVGLPNVSGHAIRRAHNVHPVAAVRAEYSLFSRHAETRLLPTLRELGIGLLARPDALFRALREADEPHDGAAKPATGHGHEERGRALLEVLREIAREKDVTPVRVALAWTLARHADVVPLVVPHNPGELADALGALVVELTAAELARMESASALDTPRHPPPPPFAFTDGVLHAFP
ncbi:MAG TPA: aldo/keto reductase [Woeseiaceae bacterium]|nr:aldo/keto reductase [Woeseiaceae bacterium]